ncbi:Dyp-type peroxidase [Halobaculum gomorrense]|uniref:Deferrochelatase/peroxidase EfeB n=1 Tax=Halobaculum gomorrense TaxID=43928 RepID=A0A1M5PAW7_9EURY|nr:Dyp-type peroxidase [Halobaculum gomorrense]SHG98589.1 deferrochelatase/peroxidase EfeB [Halobaculum gomorrense]
MTDADASDADTDAPADDSAADALSRREALKAAVAVGGATGLAACVDRLDGAEPVPAGDGPDAHPERQFAWNDFVRTDDAGNWQYPSHQTLLYLTFPREGPPADADREAVAGALDALDRAYAWSHEGLLHSAAYSPRYFERFGDPLAVPDDVSLPEPTPLADYETPEFDTQDVLVHLASDRPDALLAAERALTGDADEANGVSFPSALTDALEVDARRTGFVGAGIPRQKADGIEGIPADNPVPKASPLFMGFMAGFRQNQATEDDVTIGEGPFAEGTTKSVGNWRQRLSDWYGEQDHEQQVMEMFSPGHAVNDLVEGVGENLGDDSGIDRFTDEVVPNAKEYGRVGHAQKAARANRDGDGNPLLLRRHFESADEGIASLHFPSLQRSIDQFEGVRRAMNGVDATEATPAVRQRVNNGILEYIFVRHRGYFLVPPRSLRALPTPDGAAG